MKNTVVIIFSLLSITYTSYAQDGAWTLEACIKHAIDNNITIKQQELQTRYQENTLFQSKMSRLPSLNANASNNYSFGRALDETTYQFTDNESVVSANFYGSASLTLFNGLQTLNTIKSNEFNLEASQRDLQVIKDNISLSVAMGYLQILLNKELVAVTESQLITTKEQIIKTSKMVDAGSLAKGNLLEIEAQAALEESQLIDMQNRLTLSYLDLAQLLELDSPEGFEIVIPQININELGVVEDDVQGIYSEAESKRPEIESAKLRLKSAEYGLKVAMGARSPRLSLSTSFSTGYSDIRQRLLGIDPVTGPEYGPYSFADQINDNVNYGIGLSLSIPIFNGWQVNTGISNSKINIINSQYIHWMHHAKSYTKISSRLMPMLKPA